MNSLFKKLEEVCGIMMMFMFMLMLIVLVLILAGSFYNLTQSNERVRKEINALTAKIESVAAEQADRQIERSIEMIKAAARGALDSNAISFLFNLFSFALLSAGVFLLTRMDMRLKEIQKEKEAAEKIINEKCDIAISSVIIISIERRVSFAYHMSLLANEAENYLSLVPHLLDSLTFLKEELKKHQSIKLNLPPDIRQQQIDVLSDTKSLIIKLQKDKGIDVSFLIGLCDECGDLFRKIMKPSAEAPVLSSLLS